MDEIVKNGTILKNKNLYLVFVFLISALMAGWDLSSRAMENHECYVSVTAREMAASNDWVLPTFNGNIRLEKTPFSYWAVAGLGKIIGKFDDFTARFPSALLAFLSAIAILYFVSHCLNFRIGIISALVWATSFGYMNYSHNARPEMSLTFFVTVSFLSFYAGAIEADRKRQIIYMLIFWLSFGFGMLAKGPAPIPLLGLPIFLYFLIFKQWKVIPKLLPIIGVIIFLAITMPWPLAIGHRVNWDLVVWKQNFLDRVTGDFAPGHYPWYLYIAYTFAFLFPWSAFVPIGLLSPFYKVWDEKRKMMMYLLICFLANLAFLTLSVGKRKHYMLPIVPVFSILIGIILEDMIFTRKAFSLKYVKNVLAGHLIAFSAAIIGIGVYFFHKNIPGLFVVCIASLTLLLLIAAAFAKNKAIMATALIFIFCCMLSMYYISITSKYDNNNYTRQFAYEISKRLPHGANLEAYIHVSPRVVNYFGKVIPEVNDINQLSKDYEKGDWFLTEGKNIKKMQLDKKFNEIYYDERAEVQSDAQTAWGLFGKLR